MLSGKALEGMVLKANVIRPDRDKPSSAICHVDFSDNTLINVDDAAYFIKKSILVSIIPNTYRLWGRGEYFHMYRGNFLTVFEKEFHPLPVEKVALYGMWDQDVIGDSLPENISAVNTGYGHYKIKTAYFFRKVVEDGMEKFKFCRVPERGFLKAHEIRVGFGRGLEEFFNNRGIPNDLKLILLYQRSSQSKIDRLLEAYTVKLDNEEKVRENKKELTKKEYSERLENYLDSIDDENRLLKVIAKRELFPVKLEPRLK